MKIQKVTTQDGIVLKGILTSKEQNDTIIIHIHGMAGDIIENSFYPEMYSNYPKNGVDFLAVKQRGTGTATEFNTEEGVKTVGNAYEIFEECIYDIEAWIDHVESLGYKNIWLQAHSLGPSKVAYYMSQKKEKRINGLVWLSPSDMIGLVHTKDFEKDFNKMMSEAKQLIKKGKDDVILSSLLLGDSKISAKTFINFFSNDSNTGVFNFNDLREDWDVVESIKIPVIAFTGTDDEGIVPVVNAFQAMSELGKHLANTPTHKTVVFQSVGHDFEGAAEEIVKQTSKFINENKK